MSLGLYFKGFELSSGVEDPEPCENAGSETSADLAILSVADLLAECRSGYEGLIECPRRRRCTCPLAFETL